MDSPLYNLNYSIFYEIPLSKKMEGYNFHQLKENFQKIFLHLKNNTNNYLMEKDIRMSKIKEN